MAKPSDIYGGTVELVPGFDNTEEVARGYVHRSALVTAMAAQPGFKIIEARFRRMRAETRMAARDASDADVDAAAVKAEVFSSLCDMVVEYQFAAEFAARNIVPERTASGSDDFTEATAMKAMQEADAVAEMAKHPGWMVWLREAAARMRALVELATLTRGAVRDAVRDLYTAYASVLTEIRQILELGMDAEAWQKRHVTEATKGKE